MIKLQPMTLDDGSIIYIQAQETPMPTMPTPADTGTDPTDDTLDFITDAPADDSDRDLYDNLRKLSSRDKGEALKATVQGYTKQVIQSFKDMALAEVTEVSLEFGVNIGAGAGIPYIASGSTDCNIKISVKCEFPKSMP